MQLVIQSTLNTLEKTKSLLERLTDDELCDKSISPYYSSIGTHVRHILDFYACIFKINSENLIDLTERNRNRDVESNCIKADEYFNSIINELNNSNFDLNEKVFVVDDLGMGKVEIPYTMGAILAQANSHTIHHYAIINYILQGLNINFEDSDFGFNPTTPKVSISN